MPPSIIDFIADPQTLLTVVQGVDTGSPAARAACRAGACPCPAVRTEPIKTSSISEAFNPLLLIAELIATPPRSEADNEDRLPIIPPIGVRMADRMAIGFDM